MGPFFRVLVHLCHIYKLNKNDIKSEHLYKHVQHSTILRYVKFIIFLPKIYLSHHKRTETEKKNDKMIEK